PTAGLVLRDGHSYTVWRASRVWSAKHQRGARRSRRLALVDATTADAASTAMRPYSHRAAAKSPPATLLTTTPASPAPKAAEINWTVLIAAAAAPPSDGSSTVSIARIDRCGQVIPIPIPATRNPSAQMITTPVGASARWVAAARTRPDAITNGATAITRPT